MSKVITPDTKISILYPIDGNMPCGEDIITVNEAISIQRAAALRHNYEYIFDHDALEDFMVVHWARFL